MTKLKIQISSIYVSFFDTQAVYNKNITNLHDNIEQYQ